MYYNTGLVVVENNSYGTVILTCLQYDLGYENLYYEDQSSNSVGIKPNKNKRILLLQSLQEKIIGNKIKIKSNRLADELNTFVINPRTKKPEASRGRHDDLIISIGMACYVRDQQFRNIPIGSEIPEETLQIYRSQTYEEIKNQILQDSPLKWNSDEEESINFMTSEDDYEEIMTKYKRKNDSLLKEFGW